MAMHRRAPASSSTTTTRNARARTTTSASAATARAATSAAMTTSARPSSPAALAVNDATSSFQPGIAASGSMTSLAPDTPPAPSSFVTSGTPTGTFAQQGTWGPQSHSYRPVSATPATSTTNAGSTGLSKPALYAIIAGGSAAGVILLALIGFCCWKRRRSKAAEDDLGWRNLDKPAARPVSSSQFIHNADSLAARDYQESSLTGVGSSAGPHEKPWAQQSFSSLSSSLNEKGPARGFVRDTSDAYSLHSHVAEQQWAKRQELLGSPRGLPRSQTNGTLDSIAAPPSVFTNAHLRDSTTAQSVNSVIDFSASPRQPPRARAPSSVQHAYPPSAVPSRSPQRIDSQHPLAQQQRPREQQPYQQRAPVDQQPQEHERLSDASQQHVVAAADRHSSHPFPRASGVPSIDYAQQRIDDDQVERRVMEVMMGAQPEAARSRPNAREDSRSKTDTIAGFADVYGAAGTSDWDQGHAEVESKQQRRPARTSSRKRTPSMQTSTAPPPLPAPPVSDTAARSGQKYSDRVDSKPLRDLEALFERLPSPSSSGNAAPSSSSTASSRSRASEASNDGLSKRYTQEDAFSLQPLAPARKASLAKYQQTSRQAAPAPLRLAGKSLARDTRSQAPAHDDPLSVSMTERDLPSKLGGLQDSGPPSSVPDLTFSESSPPSSVVNTPSSEMAALPDFHLGHSPPSGLKSSYLDVSDTPTASEFESLDAMNARKHADPSYRSATMSVYGMYD
ncbi:hypothetical protein JCM8115_005483 [Rhodotorula mucilaginosa]